MDKEHTDCNIAITLLRPQFSISVINFTNHGELVQRPDFVNSAQTFLLRLRCERMGISWKNIALIFSLAVSQMAWCQDKAQLHVTDITSNEKIYVRGRIGKILCFMTCTRESPTNVLDAWDDINKAACSSLQAGHDYPVYSLRGKIVWVGQGCRVGTLKCPDAKLTILKERELR